MNMRSKMFNYLNGKSCVDCGCTNIIVFEFDHVRGKKTDDISKLMRKSWRAVEAELPKCEIVCANCHRIRTSVRSGDYRALACGNGSVQLMLPVSGTIEP